MRIDQFARYMVTTALCSVACMGAPGAFAQSSDASQTPVAAGAAPAESGLDEIVVTAQRRAENLQKVPVSIIAVGSEQLKSGGIQTLEQLNRIAPNTAIERVGLFPGAASLSMRGVGYSGIESFTDPDVAVYVNGIYQARNATALSQTLDVSSIEVLRGPQGTLFGRNAYAGAIAVRTSRPDMNEASGYAGINIGNKGLVDVDVIGNLPLVEGKVAARVAVRSHNFGGLYRNNGLIDPGLPSAAVDQTLAGKRIGEEKSLVVRPTVRLTPTDSLDIQFIAEILRQRDQASPSVSLPLAGSTILAYGGYQANPFGDKRRGIPGDGSVPILSASASAAGR